MAATQMMMMPGTKTLAQRLGEGRFPVADALRYGMILAESIRQMHDADRVHGAISPANIAITTTGLDLLVATRSSTKAITPYTAPEVLQGRPADARSDIFSFGCVLFEMLTGKRVFEGQTRSSLAAAITHSPIPASGSPAVDRLLGSCLSRNPDLRSPRMQKIMVELKLLSGAVRRADSGAASSIRRETVDSTAALAEMQQLEGRIVARMQAHERSMAELQRATQEAFTSLRTQLNHVVVDLATAQQRAAFGGPMEGGGFEAPGVEALNSRVAHLERNVEEIRVHQNTFEHSVAADLVDIEQSIRVQSSTIESARTAMSQTDDLVERVVEALESLQSSVIEQSDLAGEHATFVN